MYIQINQSVSLLNSATPIGTCVAKIKRQGTSPMESGDSEQWVEVQYFESFAFGDACDWDESNQLNVQTLGSGGPYVKRTYQMDRTSAELDAGISTQSLYDDVKSEMVEDGFAEGDLIVTP